MDVRIVCDPAKPELCDRPLIDGAQAGGVRQLFRVLANEGRVRMIHALERAGELCLSDLAREVGMSPQAVSNQVSRLADQGILSSRRDGKNVFYRVADPCVSSLLDLALCLSEEAAPASPRSVEVSL